MKCVGTLGSVIRPYEKPFDPSGRYAHQRVNDIPGFWQSYMLPDDSDTLVVLASCGRHYGRLTWDEVNDCVEYQCEHKHCAG